MITCVFAPEAPADSFMALELAPAARAGVSGRVEYAPPFGAFA